LYGILLVLMMFEPVFNVFDFTGIARGWR
jgi:hypothetical protein